MREIAARALRELLGEAGLAAFTRDRNLARLLSVLDLGGPGAAPRLEDAAALCCLGARTLNRRFHRAVRATYRAFLRSWRLLTARLLVADGEVAVKSAARTVGYASASTLVRACVRHDGHTAKGRRSRSRRRPARRRMGRVKR
jgi:transcriptional regulator GlxA family with amidase domain